MNVSNVEHLASVDKSTSRSNSKFRDMVAAGRIKGASLSADGKIVWEEKPEPKKSTRLLTFDQMAKMPDPVWLRDDPPIPEGVVTIIGKPGEGKTWIALTWALELAAEGGRPVVYIAAEGHAKIAYLRAKTWSEERGIPLPSDKFFVLPLAVGIASDHELDAFIREVEDIDPGLVVIDTLSRCMAGKDENGQKDMSAFVRGCDTICTSFSQKSNVWVVHHTGKDASKGGRGSSVLNGAVDCEVTVSMSAGHIYVANTKSPRFGEKWPEVVYHLRKVGAGAVLDFKGEAESKATEEDVSNGCHTILRVLREFTKEADAKTGLTSKVGIYVKSGGIRERTGLKYRTFQDCKAKLLKAGLILRDGSLYAAAKVD